MHKYSKPLVVLALCAAMAAAPAFAYDPPAGGSLLPLLGSAQALAYGSSVTALDAPWADRLNPAASAAQQRTVLDLGYTALTDFGDQGWGSAAAIGLSVPKPYAVWGASLGLVSTPDSMTSLPLGTLVELRGSIAKDLFPDFFVGAALDLAMGDNDGFGWGTGLDLGVMQLLGDRGSFKDMRWGATLSGLGKGYTTPGPDAGVLGGDAGSYPPPFTLSGGVRALVVRSEDWKIAAGFDLSFPSFQDVGFGLSTGISYKDLFTFRVNWDQDLRELIEDSGKSLIPSFGLTATIPLKRAADGSYLSKQGWDQAEVKPSLAASPLYDGIWALGASTSLVLGSIDKNPPKIAASFPTSKYGPFYMSPNNDGVQDSLEVPIKITDQRYVVGWSLSIANEKGEVVRKIFNKESRPEAEGIEGLWDRLTYIKKGVLVPEKLVWNGVADAGQVVPDGSYAATIEAVDDNGNRRTVGPFAIVVDNAAPTTEIVVPENPAIFSPDGDGNKDSLLIKLSGSVGGPLDSPGLRRLGQGPAQPQVRGIRSRGLELGRQGRRWQGRSGRRLFLLPLLRRPGREQRLAPLRQYRGQHAAAARRPRDRPRHLQPQRRRG